MLGNKSFIGLKIVGDEIKLIRMVPTGKQYTVDAIGSINISELTGGAKDDDSFESEDEFQPGDVFGFDNQASKSGGDDAKPSATEEISLEDELQSDLEDEAWLVDEDGENKNRDIKARIVYELQEVLFELAGKKVNLALVIPAGRAVYHTIEKTPDIKSGKKIEALIREHLEESAAIMDLKEDQYRWIEKDNQILLVATYQEQSILFDLFESLNLSQPQTYFLRAFLPEEIILMQFLQEQEPEKKLRKKKDEAETEENKGSTVLINLGKQGARIVFVQDGIIQSAMPLIFMKRASSSFVNKVFSRIIMELEKGQVAFIRKFQIHDEVGVGKDLANLLSTNFEGIEAELIKPDVNVTIDPSLEKNWEDIDLSILGATIIGSGRKTKLSGPFSFIPKYVTDRQKTFKLKWHGVLLLALILISPIVINSYYQSISNENRQLQLEVNLQANQIRDLQEIQSGLQVLDQRNAELTTELDRISELGKRSMLWTETLNILHEGMPGIGNSWITYLQFTGDNLIVEGTTMYRQRIPLISDLFYSAGIQQVARVEIRETQFFNFIIRVDRITEDDSLFDPVNESSINSAGGSIQ